MFSHAPGNESSEQDQNISALLTMIGYSISAGGAVLSGIPLILALKSKDLSMLSTTIFAMLSLTSAVLLLDVILLVSQSNQLRHQHPLPKQLQLSYIWRSSVACLG